MLCLIEAHGGTQHRTDSLYTITGIVSDAITGASLPFAHVRVDGTTRGSVCNDDGAFSIELSQAHRTIIASYVGYRNSTVTAEIGDNRIRISLEPSTALTSEVIVTASQRSQQIHLAPASLGIVTAKELSERQVPTFDQAFDQMTGVQVSRTSGSNVQALSIRGASEVAGGGIGNRVLLLIDGRPAISPESGGALWNLVPMSSIARIEVVKGAFSSLYGPSAMGGVVNVITKRPAADPVTQLHVNYGLYAKAPAYADYDQQGAFNTLSFSRSHVKGKFSYLFDLSRREDDGHREKSGYKLYNGFTKLQYDVSQNRSFYFSLNFNKINNDTPATWLSTLQPYSVAAHRKDDYQQRREWNADLQYHAIASARTRYDSRFYYYDNYSVFTFDDDPENDSTNVNIGKQVLDRSSIRAQRIGNVSQLDFAASDHHYLISGFDLKYDWIEGLPDTVLYGYHRAASVGVYLQDEMNWNKLTVTAGIRYDHYRILGEFTESNVSPKIAMVYAPTSRIAIRGLIAQAFRNPSMAERFIKFEQGGGLRFQPNPDLRAEKLIFSAEVGTRVTFGKRVDLDAALYYNNYKDLISFQQVSRPGEILTFKVINLSRAVMQGFEWSLTYRIPEYLVARIGYTFLDARDISPIRFNDVLPYKARHTAHGSVTGYYKSFALNVNGRYKSAIDEVFIYPGNEPDAHLVVNSKLSYKLLSKHQVYVAVQNIGDTQYEELERYRMAGRSYTAGAVIVF
jgi:outer membrane receptor for ferrienterochelin and colicin